MNDQRRDRPSWLVGPSTFAKLRFLIETQLSRSSSAGITSRFTWEFNVRLSRLRVNSVQSRKYKYLFDFRGERTSFFNPRIVTISYQSLLKVYIYTRDNVIQRIHKLQESIKLQIVNRVISVSAGLVDFLISAWECDPDEQQGNDDGFRIFMCQARDVAIKLKDLHKSRNTVNYPLWKGRKIWQHSWQNKENIKCQLTTIIFSKNYHHHNNAVCRLTGVFQKELSEHKTRQIKIWKQQKLAKFFLDFYCGKQLWRYLPRDQKSLISINTRLQEIQTLIHTSADEAAANRVYQLRLGIATILDVTENNYKSWNRLTHGYVSMT